MDFRKKIKLFDGEHAESVIGVSNSREAQRAIAELILKVYLSMDTRIGGFPYEIKLFDDEHAESVIGV